MGGRSKLRIHHYDSEENEFKYLGKFDSQTEVFNMYFNGKKGNLFHDNPVYRRLDDGTFVTKEPIGREGLRIAIRDYEDPCVIERKGDLEIEVVNSKGEVVGTIKNRRVLMAILERTYYPSILAGRDKSTINNVSFRHRKEEEVSSL